MSSLLNDLSKQHRLISNLFKIPEAKSEWDQYKLSKEQLDMFEEYGYISDLKLLEEWQVEKLNKELAEIADPAHPAHELFYEFHSNESSDPDTVLFHALGAWRISESFHDTIWNPAFTTAASQILGNRAIRFWHDQLFCKPAYHGGVVAWHQDYSYWTRTVPLQHLTCWVALDDATTENGCLYYVPKSHRWGLLEKPDLAGDMDGLIKYLTDQQIAEFKPVPIELKKGHATFHHPLMVHGSFANKSKKSRRAFVLNIFTDGTESNTDEALLNGVPAIKERQQNGRAVFPVDF